MQTIINISVTKYFKNLLFLYQISSFISLSATPNQKRCIYIGLQYINKYT